MKKFIIIFAILDLLVAICFFVVYGPFSSFRNLIINTAMVTKTHQYIAHTFFSDKIINEVMAGNAFIPIDEEVDLSKVVIDTKPKDKYDTEFDKEILTREENNEDYKYIPVKVGKYDAHLVAIYDPSKVRLITTRSFNTGKSQEKIINMCKRLNGKVCINGGMFYDPGMGSDIPQGYLIKDNKIIWKDNDEKAELIGMTNDHKLLLTYSTGKEAINMGMRDALQFGPFLIVNGKKASFTGNNLSRASRVAIAQRKDGIILFLVTEGVHVNGPNLLEVIETLEKYGAYNAANLDGGSSTQLVINNKLINDPKNIFGDRIDNGREVVSGFGLLP